MYNISIVLNELSRGKARLPAVGAITSARLQIIMFAHILLNVRP